MTRRERLEAKQAKREEWATKAEGRAAAHWTAADMSEARTGIPLGQPVLIGHHSEKRHRRTLERLDGYMRKASEASDMAKHHAAKAGGLADQLQDSIFSDDADAVERLSEKRTALEQQRDHMKDANAYHKKTKTLDGWTGPAEVADRGRTNLAVWRGVYERPFPAYELTNIGATIRAAAKRAVAIPKQDAIREERQVKAKAAGGCTAEYSTDWVYCSITFVERPSRAVLDDLRKAFFSWSGVYASWNGPTSEIPASVRAMLDAAIDPPDSQPQAI